MNNELLGRVVRRLRKKKGLTQAQLAELCKAAPNNISRCERGESEIGWTLFFKLSKVLDFEIEDVYNERALYKEELKKKIEGLSH